jgi:multiple sugar transport system permease protein
VVQMKSHDLRIDGNPYLYLLPGVLLLIVILVYPIAQGIADSFFRYNLASDSPKVFIGVENYVTLFGDSKFLGALVQTMVYVAAALTFEFLLGFAFALLLTQEFVGKNALRGILLLSWMMPPVVTAFVWSWILNGSYGILNYFLLRTGVISKGIEWLSTPYLSLAVATFVDIWISTPFVTLVLYAGMQGIPSQLYEAAMIDGAGSFQRMRAITLPLIKSAASVAFLMRLMMALRSFDVIWIMTRGGPAGTSEILGTFGYKKGMIGFNIGMGSAVTNLILVISLVMSIQFIRVVLRRNK